MSTISTTPQVRQTARKAAKKQASLPAHEPGAVRDYVEKTGGVIQALGRVPGSFLSGLMVGGYHGQKRASVPDYETKPLTAATGIVALNAAQGLLVGAGTAFLVLGPVGAAASVAKDAGGMAFKTYMFVEGGSAGEMGRQMADAVNSNVQSEDSRLKGLVKGAWHGGVSAAKSAAQTGFYEGRAATSGIFEGASQIKAEYGKANKPSQKSWLARTASRVAGAVSAAVSAPGGLAIALLTKESENGEQVVPSLWKRMTVASGNGAVVGAALGSLAGPLGIAVGAAVGAVAGLALPSGRESFAREVGESLQEARSDKTDLGHEITNRRRDLVETAFVGLASGARAGWDKVVN